MTDLPPPPPASPALPLSYTTLPVSRRAWPVVSTVLAWNVIVGVCLLLPVLRAERAATVTPSTQPATAPSAVRADVDLPTKLAGRYAVGAKQFLPPGSASPEDLLKSLPTDTPEAKIAAAVVAGELVGPDAALGRLDGVDDPDADAFRDVYAASASTQPTAVAATPPATRPVRDLSHLYERFGYFARLAEVHGRPDSDAGRAAVLSEAVRTMITVVAAGVIAAAAAVAGLVLFNTAVVLIVLGRLRFRVGRPEGPAHVYGESAAIYLGGFVVASLAIGLAVALLKPGHASMMVLQLLGLGLVVAVAAAWPLVRGVPVRVLRRDWGVHGGVNPLVEIGAGFVGYLAGLPVLFAGAGVTAILLKLSQTQATHPIQNEIGDAPAWSLFLLASVFAPLTEELLFRGALVSHLRGVTGAVVAALVSGLVFAAVHPQGWAAIPLLGSIGAVLAVVRQWRGSLIASITAHAVNNTFVVSLLVLATT